MSSNLYIDEIYIDKNVQTTGFNYLSIGTPQDTRIGGTTNGIRAGKPDVTLTNTNDANIGGYRWAVEIHNQTGSIQNLSTGTIGNYRLVIQTSAFEDFTIFIF
ncbi:MAG: hypothetical protein CMF62_00735 [Magnetococcales bacterium]|nr:hypothetical protein [Magnetococcales bacterium]